jgi:ABC-type branched-subunit amino acid transport system substrate-binding protein
MIRLRIFLWILLIASASAPSAQTHAERRLSIGSSMPLTGAFAESAKRLVSGARLYFDQVNRSGGIQGGRIDFQVMDDAFEPARAAENSRVLIVERNVVALLGLPGTAQVLAALPIIKQSGTPLFGPFSGSPILRKEKLPQLFHVRASYTDEIQRIVDHAKTLGIRRIGIFHTDDGLGKVVLGEVQGILAKEGVQAVGVSTTSLRDANFEAAAKELWRLHPEAIVLGTAGSNFGKFVAAYKRLGGRWPQIYGLSVVDPGTLGSEIAESARGVILTQIMPSVRNTAIPIVREYLDVLAKERPGAEPNVFELDAFVNAKILVEGLRRAGRNPTRATLISALEGMGRYDVGGFAVNFARASHSGSAYVELAIVGSNGKLRY